MAKEFCGNCGESIGNRLFGEPNWRLSDQALQLVNFYHATNYTELCQKCGGAIHKKASKALGDQYAMTQESLDDILMEFPMMTIGSLPPGISFRVLGLVTANVTAGTGIFNEFSQGISDFFGTVNSESGMAHKVNQGEAAARRILINKAISLGGNSIIGVDVDYGTTGNNSATVNMQGTAVHLDNPASILSQDLSLKAERIVSSIQRLAKLNRWILSEFEDGEEFYFDD